MKGRRALDVAERTLPHNLEAERAILGSILLHNDAYAVVGSTLQAGDFYRQAHQRIFASLDRLLEWKGGRADYVTLREDLEKRGELEEVGGPVYLTGLTDGIARAANIEHYARIVKDKAQLRGAIYAMNKVISQAYEAEETPAEIFGRVDKALLDLQANGGAGRMLSLEQSGPALMENLEWRAAHKGEVTGVATGFASVDAITLGWQPGELVILAARPSIGKTTFVLNSAGRCGTRCAMFSLEMRRQQLEYRYLSSLSGVPLSRILSGQFMEADWVGLTKARDQMMATPIYINDSSGMTIREIRSECRRLQSEEGLGLVVIDYVQLIKGSADLPRGASRNEIVSDISGRAKDLAGELGVPVLLLSQLSRAAEKRDDPRPRLSDLRESGSLEQDADIVAFLHRRNHREGGLTYFLLDKQRNGPTGSFRLTLDRDTVTFTDGYEGPEPEAAPARRRKGKIAASLPDSPVQITEK